ncbi:putative clathrin assembly protein at5g35200 [Phtheirospermum japonicum]|uniref:Putative clathrin assembly protein at5g35200 n=1 Tax=Phtheirospermum japonicum TaxID=374723 RepID=A0A830BK74_9LAMI|nr:putative clathrin assembly protein at5g35200 [Phtheirospermum japonicum]
MAAGSSSQQNFRKAIGVIKDSTSVGLAKVNSEYKDLNVSILKATNHVEVLPKEKHVRIILGAVSGSRPRADVSFCIHALSRRLAKTRTWVVALKTLIVIHRALREVDHSFCEELICHNKGRGHLLNLLHFKDDSSPSAWDYSAWIRTYALYIEECLECFRVLKYDFHRDHSRTKKLDTPALLEQLPALQNLLFRLLGCEPLGVARYNFMIQYALSIVAAESVRLYVAITDGVLMLVDKFFEMPCRDAVRALEIYRKSGLQAHRLSEFFEMCRTLEFGRRQKYVKIEQNDEMQKLIAAVPAADMETDSNQLTTEEKPDPSDDECTESNKSDKDTAPLIPDLLSWDEPSQEASESDEMYSLPLALVTPGMSDPTINSELSTEPASWELALVNTTPTSSVALNKGGVLDRSLLDSLYDAALTQTNTNGPYQMTQTNTNGSYKTANAPSNPFESDAYDHPQTFYDPGLAANPSYMHLAEIPQQQVPFMQQQQQDHQPTQPIIGYDYMQMIGINPQQQQQELSIVSYDYNQQQQQQQSPFVGQDFMQMTNTPQLEVPMQQQEKPVVGPVDSTSTTSRNPFDDYEPSPLPGAPQTTQPSDFSFI